MDITMRGNTEKVGGSSYIMGEEYRAKIPGIERSTRIKSEYGILLNKGENQQQRFHYVDPEIFEMFDNVNSLEKDLFPKLARMKQLIGFFTYGEYLHLE